MIQGTLDLLVKARYYAITKAGQQQLAREKQHWRSITMAVERVIEGA